MNGGGEVASAFDRRCRRLAADAAGRGRVYTEHFYYHIL